MTKEVVEESESSNSVQDTLEKKEAGEEEALENLIAKCRRGGSREGMKNTALYARERARGGRGLAINQTGLGS